MPQFAHLKSGYVLSHFIRSMGEVLFIINGRLESIGSNTCYTSLIVYIVSHMEKMDVSEHGV